MHLFGLARLKSFANRYSSPAPTLQCWGLIGDEEHSFMFQHCHVGAEDDFTVRCQFFCNNFVQDCITARKAADISNGFWCVILNALINFRKNFTDSRNGCVLSCNGFILHCNNFFYHIQLVLTAKYVIFMVVKAYFMNTKSGQGVRVLTKM